ncbi:MAG TPA: hypothetical protein VM184_05970 [Gaiellaceae bacterium]|nr:hypothetical protein [Gaiellaceae bacterium]
MRSGLGWPRRRRAWLARFSMERHLDLLVPELEAVAGERTG